MNSTSKQPRPRVQSTEPFGKSDITRHTLSRSEFNTAMVHLYRGEVGRANTWRLRLDGTTNWAVLTTGATLSFAFSSTSETTHVMILVNSLLILYFLYIEARRYMFYDLWRTRVRLMEIEFFAEMLTPDEVVNRDHWRELLADELIYPRFRISIWRALGRRLRRNYIWIFAVLLVSWVVKIVIHPVPAQTLSDVYNRIGVGPIPVWLVVAGGIMFNIFIIFVAIWTRERGAEDDETSSRHRMQQKMKSTELDGNVTVRDET